MIVLDANVVLALARPEQERHATTIAWLEDVRMTGEVFGVPALVWHALVRLATNRRIIDPPADLPTVFRFIDALRSVTGYRDVSPGTRHLTLFRDLCEQAAARANLVTDAAIAAIAVENGATVASFDRDFARFPGLRWVVPGE